MIPVVNFIKNIYICSKLLKKETIICYIAKMVRAVKNTSAEKQTTTTVSTTPVVVETSAAKPRVKKVKTVNETVSVSSVPAAVTPVVETVVTSVAASSEVVAEVTDSNTLSVKMTEFSAKLQQLAGLFSTIKNDFKTLEKTVARDFKNAQKASAKKRRSNGNRQPSGFVKPTRISDELAEFLGKTIGTEMARTSVSKEINAYIRLNSLQDKSNGRKINPDAKLSKLLKINNGDELTYFNLQKYMKHHFVKAGDAVVVVADA